MIISLPIPLTYKDDPSGRRMAVSGLGYKITMGTPPRVLWLFHSHSGMNEQLQQVKKKYGKQVGTKL